VGHCLWCDIVAVLCCAASAPQALRNTVTVPRHWSQKRKYLQGKRGIEKPAFKLPDFIEATGVCVCVCVFRVQGL
jgi:hypothetical protein